MLNKKIGIYVRVSTVEQATTGISIDAQIEKLEQYCKQNDWDTVKKYIDAGISGSTIDRPKLKNLIDDCKSGKVNVILVYKLDRLSRSLRDIILTIDELKKYNVDFVSLTEQIDTTTAVGQLMFHIIGAFAEFERNIIRERVIFGMDKKAKDGHAQYKAPYGYTHKNGNLVILENEAREIRNIFAAYLSMESTTKVARIFDMQRSHVHRILTNQTYLGKVKWKGEIIEGGHEAIVDRETFERVQIILHSNKKH